MTISSTTVKNSYNGNGSTATFSYTFKIFQDSDLQVIIRSSTGTETVKTLTTHYTVTGAGNSGGGSITFTSGNIPTSTQTVVIRRNLPQTQSIDYIANDPFPAESHEEGLDRSMMAIQQLQEEVSRSIKLSRTNTINSTEFTTGAADRAGKILGFDSSGELSIVVSELGSYRGNWSTATDYAQRDLVKDTTTNNIYYVNTVHTSTGSQPLTSNVNSAYYQLIIDAASATTSATNAANSATAAAASATTASGYVATVAASASSASTSATNASNSASTASTQASNAASSASAASSSATSAANSASTASAAYDDFDDRYLGSKSSAPTLDNDGNFIIDGALYWNSTSAQMFVRNSGSWIAIKPTSGDQSNIDTAVANIVSIQNASSNASSAATSASNAASSASAASTSATNAASSASSASSSASSASTSATNAATSATSAQAALTSVENLFDNFDDRFLGTKTSNPTLDNDGNALSVGAVYYNSVAQQVRFYNGSTWDAPSASAATSATNAAASASAASTSASNAASSASIASTAASNAESSYDAFDDRYLGSKSSAPSLDNDGNALLTGAIYWNSTNNQLYIWTGSAWNAAAFSASGAVTSFNTRSGAVTLTSNDVTSAIGFTPISSSSTDTLTNKTITGSTNTITNLDASNLSTGTVPSARLSLTSSDIPSLDASKITTGTISSSRLSLTSSDLPTVPTSKGGTGLTTIGTANQYLKVNSGATGLEYGTVDLSNLSASNLTSGTIPAERYSTTDVVTPSATQTLTNKTLTSPVISSITNTGTITLPTSTDTLVGKATTDTLTNKSISGSSNTLTNIPNSALTNSSITINGSSVSLGGSATIDAGVFNETIVTPTANQTTFTTAYTVNYVQVFVNGIKLLNGVDFTATNGTSIVLTSGVSTTDRVEIVKFK